MKSSIQKRIAVVAEALHKVALSEAKPPSANVVKASNSVKELLDTLITLNFLNKKEVQLYMSKIDLMLSSLKKEVLSDINFTENLKNRIDQLHE